MCMGFSPIAPDKLAAQSPTARPCVRNSLSCADRNSDPFEPALERFQWWPRHEQGETAVARRSQYPTQPYLDQLHTSEAARENPAGIELQARTTGKCWGSHPWFRSPKAG